MNCINAMAIIVRCCLKLGVTSKIYFLPVQLPFFMSFLTAIRSDNGTRGLLQLQLNNTPSSSPILPPFTLCHKNKWTLKNLVTIACETEPFYSSMNEVILWEVQYLLKQTSLTSDWLQLSQVICVHLMRSLSTSANNRLQSCHWLWQFLGEMLTIMYCHNF